MSGEQLAATFTAVSVVLIGAVVQYLLEMQRRKSERRAQLLGEQKAVYASYMGAIVAWQHAVRREHEARTGAVEGVDARAAAAVAEARQSAMMPLFELRLIGSQQVRERAEDVVTFNYWYEDQHAPGATPPEHPVPRWVEVRDAFIAQVRSELADAGLDDDTDSRR